MELYGLRVIATEALERGTVCAIAPPPERSEFKSDADYEVARREWERSQYWVVTTQSE